MRAPRGVLWLTLVLAVAAACYCGVAILMVASLSGAPNYPLDRAIYNQQHWGLGLVISAGAIMLSAFLLFRKSRH